MDLWVKDNFFLTDHALPLIKYKYQKFEGLWNKIIGKSGAELYCVGFIMIMNSLYWFHQYLRLSQTIFMSVMFLELLLVE